MRQPRHMLRLIAADDPSFAHILHLLLELLFKMSDIKRILRLNALFYPIFANYARLDQCAWQKYSIYPDKPLSKEGLREIIHRERRIELAMEGARTWDLRRWKEAENELNKDVRTWNIDGADKEDYYNVISIDRRSFTRKEYLWPIKEYNLTVNKNLVQNYGW